MTNTISAIMRICAPHLNFHRNSVVNADFDKLEVGAEVRFDGEMGERGSQATAVHLVGKHHIVGKLGFLGLSPGAAAC
ncbi:MAG TPA: hypothetical protein VFP00_09115 [Burkholderiales bacterium]|nr:hypothetical protein [Burkholderiales bacterium]